MTHPLTPREKVAQIIKEKVSGPHFTDPSHFVAMEQDRFAAADAILTALASGSGDHAELARLAEAVGLLRKFHEAWRSGCGWLPSLNVLDDEITAFLSKEAERG